MIGSGLLIHCVKRRAEGAERGGAFLGDQEAQWAQRAGNLLSEPANSNALLIFMHLISF